MIDALIEGLMTIFKGQSGLAASALIIHRNPTEEHGFVELLAVGMAI